jgi:hypothetical protein
MADLEAPIQRMIDATNRGDTEAFLDCFTEDAHLVDWGREFRGQSGVASWNQTDNIGKQAHFEALAQREDGDDYVVTMVVTGGGYNGTGDIVFTLDGERISRMIIG